MMSEPTFCLPALVGAPSGRLEESEQTHHLWPRLAATAGGPGADRAAITGAGKSCGGAPENQQAAV